MMFSKPSLLTICEPDGRATVPLTPNDCLSVRLMTIGIVSLIQLELISVK
jgi:hypothetical protein